MRDFLVRSSSLSKHTGVSSKFNNGSGNSPPPNLQHPPAPSRPILPPFSSHFPALHKGLCRGDILSLSSILSPSTPPALLFISQGFSMASSKCRPRSTEGRSRAKMGSPIGSQKTTMFLGACRFTSAGSLFLPSSSIELSPASLRSPMPVGQFYLNFSGNFWLFFSSIFLRVASIYFALILFNILM